MYESYLVRAGSISLGEAAFPSTRFCRWTYPGVPSVNLSEFFNNNTFATSGFPIYLQGESPQ